jgi:hypothetical protein
LTLKRATFRVHFGDREAGERWIVFVLRHASVADALRWTAREQRQKPKPSCDDEPRLRSLHEELVVRPRRAERRKMPDVLSRRAPSARKSRSPRSRALCGTDCRSAP